MNTLMLILVLTGIFLLWLDGARAREIATELCKHACRRRGLQFLEGTVFLQRLSPRWTGQGLKFQRQFQFDYSVDGTERHTGRITLLGRQLKSVHADFPGKTIDGKAVRVDEST